MKRAYNSILQHLAIPVLLVFIFGSEAQAHRLISGESDTARIASLNKQFDAALKLKAYETAKAYADTLLILSRTINNNTLVGNAYFSYGLIEKEMKNRNAFIEFMKSAAAYYRRDNAYRLAGKCYFFIGQTYVELNDERSALDYYHESYAMREKSDDSLGLANVTLNIASLSYKSGDYSTASEYYFRALKMSDNLKNDKLKATCLSNLSHLSNKMNNYGQSLEYLKQALDLQRRLGNRLGESNVLSNYGNVYVEMKEYEKAKEHFEQAIEIRNSINDEKGIALALVNLGVIARLESDTAKAKQYFDRALIIGKKTGDKEVEANVLSNLALIKSASGDKSAEQMLIASLEKSKVVGNPVLIMANYKNLKEFYEKEGNALKALEFATLYQTLSDSTFKTGNAEKLLELQTKYETAEKERQLIQLRTDKLAKELQLQKANQLKYSLIGLSVFLLALAAALYSRYLMKKRSQAQLLAVNLKLNELNSTKDKLFSVVSHDLRNSVSAFDNIAGLLIKKYDQMDPADLKYYIGEMSATAGSMKTLFRNLLDWAKSQQNKILVAPETVNARQLLLETLVQVRPKIEAMKLTPEIICEENLQFTSDANIINTVLRNLLSNAAKYSKPNSKVILSGWQEDSNVHFAVQDEGIGMTPDEVKMILESATYLASKPGTDGERGAGLGLMLSRELLQKISGTLKISSDKNRGSTFEVVVPVILQQESSH